MSCPYFEPVAPLDDAGGKFAMLPLGGAWSGVCHAVAGEACAAGEDAASRSVCNLGYARGRCARFPLSHGPDAVRFALAADRGGGVITVRYAVEKDHHPYRHGTLAVAADAPAAASLLDRQAGAYIRSYLRRTAASK